MHFSDFENLNIQEETEISFTNLTGTDFNGIYKGNYSRSRGSFNFFNFKGSTIETIYLKDIEEIEEND
jgi:hypothetical protein